MKTTRATVIEAASPRQIENAVSGASHNHDFNSAELCRTAKALQCP
jgi:hypothetical protein